MTVMSEEGYLSSALSEEFSANCPWHIRTPSGRPINITLYTYPALSDGQPNSACYEALVLKEKLKRNILVCPSDPKVKAVTVTDGNEVEITFPAAKYTDKTGVFIVHFKGEWFCRWI